MHYGYNHALYFSYPDIVVYLLHTTSFATLEEVKNYKSLQSFKYFTSGWVHARYPVLSGKDTRKKALY